MGRVIAGEEDRQIRPSNSKPMRGPAPPSSQAALPTGAPPPQRKQRKSLLWAIGMLVAIIVVGTWAWEQFIRTSAYAVVEAESLYISSPISGFIESLSVIEDQSYESGFVACSISNREARDELESAQLRLRLLESQLLQRRLLLQAQREEKRYEHEMKFVSLRAQLAEARIERAEIAVDISKSEVKAKYSDSSVDRIAGLVERGTASSRELSAAEEDSD